MKRVLIVDDSLTVRKYHRLLVEALGYSVEEAENGVEALEKALLGEFDLFLVDVNMPKMDGYSLVQEFRKTPEFCAVPAVMISTEAEAGDRAKAYAAGANAYLVKPVASDVLQNYVTLLAGEALP